MKKTRSKKVLANSDGAVLIIGLLLFTVMLVLGSLYVRNMAKEVEISGSYETTTRSLFIAEGGLETIKGKVKSIVSSKFSASGFTVGNTQEFQVDTAPATAIDNPLNWVDDASQWYTTLDSSTLALSNVLTSANATWPIYRKVAIGTDYAVVTLERPLWNYQYSDTIRLGITSTSDNVSNTELLRRKVAGVIEADLDNNLLVFQAFTNPADQTSYIDNLSNDNVAIGIGQGHPDYSTTEYDYGINAGGDNAITGIATYDNMTDLRGAASSSAKYVVIQQCTGTDGVTGAFTGCTDYGVADVNTTNKTFILGGSGHGCLFGGTYTAPGDTLAVPSSQRYKVLYKTSTSVTCP